MSSQVGIKHQSIHQVSNNPTTFFWLKPGSDFPTLYVNCLCYADNGGMFYYRRLNILFIAKSIWVKCLVQNRQNKFENSQTCIERSTLGHRKKAL